MTKMTLKEQQVDWIATKNTARFQELLNDETDDGRYRILSQLLAEEFGKIKMHSAGRNMTAEIKPDSVTDDIGDRPLAAHISGRTISNGTSHSMAAALQCRPSALLAKISTVGTTGDHLAAGLAVHRPEGTNAVSELAW